MKINKLKFLVFAQIFLLSTIILTDFSHRSNYFPVWKHTQQASLISIKSKWLIWDNNGTTICTAANAQQYVQLCSDGAGGAIISWKDERTDAGDIYAQRINSSGGVEWTANGTAICTAANAQEYVQLCSDGVGGAIITWADRRVDGTFTDIYVQRVNSSGGVEWTGNGTVISDEPGYQIGHQLCSDGAGGAIVTWEDNTDIYAQRVNSSGGVEWAANGIAICTPFDFQRLPQLCSDGAGGAIITWQDERTDAGDIYAQRINSSGGVE
ncbi:MAG: hypothetical protein HWN67_22160, partial [Candidatus Helarchaeota archaeon]|nr:hypothetical protein [Candidatus Helarchaeota archaeon]